MKNIIIKAEEPFKGTVYHNTRELKRLIKKSKNRKFVDGLYNFVDKFGKLHYQVRYSSIVTENNKIRLKGEQRNKF